MTVASTEVNHDDGDDDNDEETLMGPDDAMDFEFAAHRTIAAYCQTVDDGRHDEFAELWAEDAVLWVLGDQVRGRAAIREWIVQAQPPQRRGLHVTVNPVVEVVDTDHARASTDFLFYAMGADGPHLTVTGRYLDTLVRVADRAMFASRRILMRGADGLAEP